MAKCNKSSDDYGYYYNHDVIARIEEESEREFLSGLDAIAESIKEEYCGIHDCRRAEFEIDDDIVYVCPLCKNEVDDIKKRLKKKKS